MPRFIVDLLWRIDLILLISLLLLLWNLFIFTLFGIDKSRSIKNKWRVSESFLIACSLLFGGIGAWMGRKIFKHKTKKIKFKIAIPLALIIISIPLIHIVHGLTLDRIIVYREIDFVDLSWTEELNGYRIGFVTDFHLITEESMQEVVDELNQRDLDLLLLGGDFSTFDDHYRTILGIISQVDTADGIWGVEGNHDIAWLLFAAKEDYGIGILDNDGLYLHPQFFLSGVQDLWNRQPDIAYATADANENSFILLVSHNPDLTMSQPTDHVDLILSGHTHGGQIALFGWPFYLNANFSSVTDYGTRFNGWAESADGTPVYSSVGIGDYYIWPRIFARPEVIILTMYHE